MAICLFHSGLYRKIAVAAILGLLTGSSLAQIARRRAPDRGPRALGLIEFGSNGKAHLIPVSIMIDGRFYDAGSYKADPVPMALQPETIYEGLKSGASAGLFTVSGAVRENGGWLGDGKWQSSEQIEADKERAKAEAAKKGQKSPAAQEQAGGPPRLRRGERPTANSPTPSPAPAPAPKESKPDNTSQPPKALTGDVESSDRPILRRQAPSEISREQTKSTEPEKSAGSRDQPKSAGPEKPAGSLTLIAAISDADGPEPRRYAYSAKPAEEQGFLKKMLALASAEVEARASELSVRTVNPKPAGARARPAPEFTQVALRIFDLSSSNEPVLVLTANARIRGASPDLEYMTAVVARQDIYGDLHKNFARTTDKEHLDVAARYELIDAVDADGDGRGELLFRTSWDTGSAFSLYRVLGDQLWPLFEGKPGS